MRRFLNWLFPDAKCLVKEHELKCRVTHLESENQELRDLISHCWVHAGYPDCGYNQMDINQKSLYRKVIKEENEKAEIY